MGDFQKIATRGKKSVDGYGDKKPWNLCGVDGCECRWTHSDVPGSTSGYCGYHYHAFKDEQALAEWKKRDAKAREDGRRKNAGGPRYLKFGKEDVA